MSWRLVNDGVEAQMGMLESEIVPIEPVLWPEVMMPDGRTLGERIRSIQFVLPPADESETSDGPTIPIIEFEDIPLDEDLQQAQETASRLQTTQRRPQARPRGRRPRETR